MIPKISGRSPGQHRGSVAVPGKGGTGGSPLSSPGMCYSSAAGNDPLERGAGGGDTAPPRMVALAVPV